MTKIIESPLKFRTEPNAYFEVTPIPVWTLHFPPTFNPEYHPIRAFIIKALYPTDFALRTINFVNTGPLSQIVRLLSKWLYTCYYSQWLFLYMPRSCRVRHRRWWPWDSCFQWRCSMSHGPCVSTVDTYECSCNGHYSGNGKVCVDATECDSDNINVNEWHDIAGW